MSSSTSAGNSRAARAWSYMRLRNSRSPSFDEAAPVPMPLYSCVRGSLLMAISPVMACRLALVNARCSARQVCYSSTWTPEGVNSAIAALAHRRAPDAPPRRQPETDAFPELDHPALQSLLAEPFVYAEWRLRRVTMDRHAEVRSTATSRCRALHRTSRRITERTVELFHKGERIAAYPRSSAGGRDTITHKQHAELPSPPRRSGRWSACAARREGVRRTNPLP